MTQDHKTLKIDISGPVLAAVLVSLTFSLLALGLGWSNRSQVEEHDRGLRSVVQFLNANTKQQPAK